MTPLPPFYSWVHAEPSPTAEYCRSFGFLGVSGMAPALEILQILEVPELLANTQSGVSMVVAIWCPCLACQGWASPSGVSGDQNTSPHVFLIGVMRASSSSPPVIPLHTVHKALADFSGISGWEQRLLVVQCLGCVCCRAGTVAGLILCPWANFSLVGGDVIWGLRWFK